MQHMTGTHCVLGLENQSVFTKTLVLTVTQMWPVHQTSSCYRFENPKDEMTESQTSYVVEGNARELGSDFSQVY